MKRPLIVIFIIFFLYFLAVTFAYQSNFNFFSVQSSYGNTIFVQPKIGNNTNVISMLTSPIVTMQLTAKENNFEIITMHISRKLAHVKTTQLQKLVFKIRGMQSSHWYAENTYNVIEIGDSQEHPFGFPLIPNSKGHTYVVELSMMYPKGIDYITINATDGSIKGVYLVSKSDLIKHPAHLFEFISTRLGNVFENREAQEVTLLALPLVLVLFAIIFS